MTERAHIHASAHQRPSSPLAPGLAVQRKCDCGGRSSSEDDKEQQAPIQRSVASRDEAGAAARLGHNFGAVQVHVASATTAQPSRPEAARSKGEAGPDSEGPEDDEAKVERSATPMAPPSSDGGRPLPEAVRARMEAAFGVNFASVRIHEGPQATAIDALAYTQGTDIHFAPGRYDPLSSVGQRLLGHELTHVVQQQAGQVPRPQAKSSSIVQDWALEAEADLLGAQAARGESVRVRGATAGLPATTGALTAIQRATISWDAEDYTAHASGGDSTTVEKDFNIKYKASEDKAAKLWKLQVDSLSGGAKIDVHTGGSRNPDSSPPTTEAEAQDAVKVMKGYYSRGKRGSWHTEGASKAHELHHYKEWKCSAEHYWPDTQTALEKLTVGTDKAATEADAITAMRAGASGADAKMTAFKDKAHAYWFTLSDSASSRPYAAGQLALNPSITAVQTLATGKGWTVEAGTDTPSDATPCYQPWLPYTP